jgi:microcystin-dependent protein
MSYSIFTNSAIQNSNLSTKDLTNFLTTSSNKINLNGNLGIGTNILFQRFHINDTTFNMNLKISNENKIRSSTYNTYYALLPIGSIIIYTVSSSTYYNMMINNGWIECNGQTVTLANYPLLETLLQNSSYGNNGPYPQSSFKVPNFKDIIPIGAGGSIPSSDINTTHSITMNINQIPQHKHDFTLGSDIANHNSSHKHRIGSVPPQSGRDINKSGGENVAATKSGETGSEGTHIHRHDVMLPSNSLATTNINLRHNVIYMIYLIKGR